MSGKTGKRARKRVVEIEDDTASIKNSETESLKNSETGSAKNLDTSLNSETGSSVKVDSESDELKGFEGEKPVDDEKTEVVVVAAEEVINGGGEGKKDEENGVGTNGNVETKSNGNVTNGGTEELFPDTEIITETETIEMEPLIIDNNEPDPELQFDEKDCSDIESRKDSPVLLRCKTRRSQTRNIPTPKTPKSTIDDKEAMNTPIPTPTPTPTPDVIEESSTADVLESNASEEVEDEKPVLFEKPDLNETQESCISTLSTKVNIGSDDTRDIDSSANDKDSFLSQSKDLSLVETVRKMRCRKSIRRGDDMRRSVLQPPTSMPFRQTSRASIERLVGTKRKRSETPDGAKRYKVEDGHTGLFAYIKSKFSSPGRGAATSTPKLTGYRRQEDGGEDVMADGAQPGKKWCAIM